MSRRPEKYGSKSTRSMIALSRTANPLTDDRTRVMKLPRLLIVASMAAWLAGSSPVGAQQSNTSQGPRFGGPDSVENLLRNDAAVDRPSLFDRWFEWKNGLKEKHGFSFSVDYSAVGLGVDESPADDRAAGGMIRFFGAWELVGRGTLNNGSLVWKVEHRHAYTDIAPSGFGFNLGYIGLIEPPFSDQGTRLTNLYWRQRLAGGRGLCFELVSPHLLHTDHLHSRIPGAPLRSADPPRRDRSAR